MKTCRNLSDHPVFGKRAWAPLIRLARNGEGCPETCRNPGDDFIRARWFLISLWQFEDLTNWTEIPVVESVDQSGVEAGFRRVGATVEGPFEGTPALYRFKFTR